MIFVFLLFLAGGIFLLAALYQAQLYFAARKRRHPAGRYLLWGTTSLLLSLSLYLSCFYCFLKLFTGKIGG